MTAVGTTTPFEGVMAQEFINVILPEPTGYTYTSKLSEIFGVIATPGTTPAGSAQSSTAPFSGRTIRFTSTDSGRTDLPVDVLIIGRL